MAQVILIAHLPLFRMKRNEDLLLFESTYLTKLDWNMYDELTQGAFSDWRAKYAAADPVFLWFQQDLDLPLVGSGPAEGMLEMKLPEPAWRTQLPKLGLGLITAFHQAVVDPVWAALSLALPAGIIPSPRDSVTFFLPAGDNHFALPNGTTNGVRVQGDGDQELVYLADGASEPVDDDQLAEAAARVPLAQAALELPEVSVALRQFLQASDVVLTSTERMLMAVATLENLLLPDVTAGSGDVFAKRLSHLLGVDDEHRESVFAGARDLYRVRSALIHAAPDKASRFELVPAAAEQLLAGAIEGITVAAAGGQSVAEIRERLDDGPLQAPPRVVPVEEPKGAAAGYRLGPRKAWFAGTFSARAALSSPEGTIVSWSPLVGLAHEGELDAHPELGVALTDMDANSVVSMEEKDVRRDFIQKVSASEKSLAALAVVAPEPKSVVDEEHVRPLTRIRDLAVVGLRLTGLSAFIDPELLGWYVYDGNLRHRRETVFRQSVIMGMGSAPHAEIEPARREALFSAWSMLARYREACDPRIDQLLDMYRRAHDRRFTPPATRAALLWICLEAALGRFGGKRTKASLEATVAVLDGVKEEAVSWFGSRGREFRNQTAHGEWNPEPLGMPELWESDHEPLTHLVDIGNAVVRTLIHAWVEADPGVRARKRPGQVLAGALKQRL